MEVIPPIIRSSFAAIAIVAVVAVGGLAIWLNQSQPPLDDGRRDAVRCAVRHPVTGYA